MSVSDLRRLDYSETSHTFSKGVIAAYCDVFKNGVEANHEMIKVRLSRGDRVFLLDPNLIDKVIRTRVRATEIYSSEYIDVGEKVCEVEYDLYHIFNTIKCSRGINLTKRKEVDIVDFSQYENKDSERILKNLFLVWKETKIKDGVYQITFNPNRYLRSFAVGKAGFSVYERLILINQIPYGLICFYLTESRAFELAFISDYRNPKLKIINDLNECILVYVIHDLYTNFQIKTMNAGVDPGLKGLRIFKKKLPSEDRLIYRLRLDKWYVSGVGLQSPQRRNSTLENVKNA